MIHVINKHNRHLYRNTLNDMFQLRHSIFVDGKKWDHLRKPNGLEQDEFDTINSTYILKLSSEDEILGGMRLYPTTGPTQLNTIFKDTCVLSAQPSAPEHYEWSRYFITDPRHRSKHGKPVHMELYAGILEYAVAMNIKSLSGYIEVNTFMRSKRMPWDMRQLGIPTEYGGKNGEPTGYGLPTLLTLDETMLQKTKAVWRMIFPILSLSLGADHKDSWQGYKAEAVIAIQNALSLRSSDAIIHDLVEDITFQAEEEMSEYFLSHPTPSPSTASRYPI